jgi:hypothetical protein
MVEERVVMRWLDIHDLSITGNGGIRGLVGIFFSLAGLHIIEPHFLAAPPPPVSYYWETG